MVKSPILAVSAIICGFILSSCQPPAKPPEPEKPKTPTPRRLIGRISSAPKGQNFILIQSYTAINLPIGTVLTTHGADNRVANIVITGEALGNFAAADLQSGTLEVGDAVYLPNLNPESNDAESTESTDSQQLSETQNS